MTVAPPYGSTSRAGWSALELLIALALAVLLGGLVGRTIVDAARIHARTVADAEALQTAGLIGHVLSLELSAPADQDRHSSGGTSTVTLRAFRASALICPDLDPEGRLIVRVRGDRQPDPAKDSLLVLTRSGRWISAALEGRSSRTPGCPSAPSATTEVWTVSEAIPDGVLVRVFERGTYHLSDSTFRWSRGDGGRQPLTPARLDPDRSRVRVTSGVVEVDGTVLGPGGRPDARTWRIPARARP